MFCDTLLSRTSADYRWRVFFAKFLQSYLECQLVFLLLTVVDSGRLTHLDWSLLVSVLDCLPGSAFTNCPLWVPLPTDLLWVPLPTDPLWLLSDLPFLPRRRPQAQAFVWFCAKTDKEIICLAFHPHCGIWYADTVYTYMIWKLYGWTYTVV